jgi:hypothetical protein
MRTYAAALVLVMLATGIASAGDAATVQKLVKANIAAIANDDDEAFQKTLADVVQQVLPPGQGEMDTLAERFYGRRVMDVKHTVGKMVVTVDAKAGTAWFYTTVVAKYRIEYDPKPGPWKKENLRVAGLAVKSAKNAWRLAAISYATVFDALLAPDAKAKRPTLVIDGAGAELADWITKGTLAANGATTIAAIHAEDGSIGTGTKAALSLAATWDAKPLVVGKLSGKDWGTMAFVSGSVLRPDAKGGGTPLTLAALVVREGEAWRWVYVGLTQPLD